MKAYLLKVWAATLVFLRSVLGIAGDVALEMFEERYGKETLKRVLDVVLDVEWRFTDQIVDNKGEKKMQMALTMLQPFIDRFGDKAVRALIEYTLSQIEIGTKGAV